MTKQEIQERLYECKNDDEIRKLIQDRIEELKIDTDITVGQCYTDSFNEFISDKVHYKAASKAGNNDSPDLVYDDKELYFSIIKYIKEKTSYYNELILFSELTYGIYKYLPGDGSTASLFDRSEIYYSGAMNKKNNISIKEIIAAKCAFCSEKAGLSHNIFKLLGIDSSLIVGKKDNENHAYNVIYPRGYYNSPAVLYDPSFWLDFINDENKEVSMAYFKVLTDEEFKKLKSGEYVTLDFKASEDKLKKYYNSLNEFEMKPEISSYSIGLEKSPSKSKESELQKLEEEQKDLQEELESVIKLKDKVSQMDKKSQSKKIGD